MASDARNAWAVTLNDLQVIEQRYNELVAAKLYKDAVPFAEKLADGVKSLFGVKHKSYGQTRQLLAQAYNNAGITYDDEGKYGDAERLYRQALSIREQTLGADSAEAAQSCDNLGNTLYHEGRYADALQMHTRAAAAREKTGGADNLIYADTLNNLAGDQWALGHFKDAEATYNRALAIQQAKLGENDPKVARTLGNIGLLVETVGRFSDAETVLVRAVSILDKGGDANASDLASSLSTIGKLYLRQGRYDEAEAAQKRSLAIRQKLFGKSHPSVAESLTNLGNVYFYLSRYSDAESMLRQALTIRESGNPEHRDVATILQILAGVYYDLGSQPESEALRTRSLAILEKALGKDHPDVAVNLTSLSENYIAEGRLADAEPLLRRALAIREKAAGDDSGIAWTLNALAELCRKQGRPDDAEQFYRRALGVREMTLGPDHMEVALSLQSLGDFYRTQGLFEKSEPLLQRALAVRRQTYGDNHRDVAETYASLAKLYFARGSTATALDSVRHATAALEARDKTLSGATVGHRDDVGDVIKPYFVEHVAIAYRAAAEGLAPTASLVSEGLRLAGSAERTAAGTALTQMAVRFASGNGPFADVVRLRQDLGRRWQAQENLLVQALSAPQEERTAASTSARAGLADLASQIAAIDERLARDFPAYKALTNPDPLSAKDVQALLAADEGFVTYLVGESKTYVFAITRESIGWKELPVSAAALNKSIADIRLGLDIDAIALKRSEPVRLEALHALYREIWEPIAAQIKGKPKLMIVPDGALTSLPFQVLVSENPVPGDYRNAAWLVRQHAITVLPSIASLKSLRTLVRPTKATKPLIAFGNPIFSPEIVVGALPGQKVASLNSMRGGFSTFFRGGHADLDLLRKGLPQLPGTADELHAVALTLGVPQSEIRLGADATEHAVKSAALANYRIVYFATHGLVAGDINGLAEPALALTLPQRATADDDGLLTASEIAELKLDADWVVLSACNTAAGDKPGAEGLSGLARAFFFAGARALLVSHWPVDDRATASIASNLFGRLNADPKLGRAEALQQAMIAFLSDTSREENGFPGLWAPFIVVGEGRR